MVAERGQSCVVAALNNGLFNGSMRCALRNFTARYRDFREM